METLNDNQVEITQQTDIEQTITFADAPDSEALNTDAQPETKMQPEEVVMPKLKECQVKRHDPEYRRSLIYSALGIVLSPFIIAGLIFAVFGIITSRNELAFLKEDNLKPSQTLLWAFWLGITGIIVNAGVLLIYILFAIL